MTKFVFQVILLAVYLLDTNLSVSFSSGAQKLTNINSNINGPLLKETKDKYNGIIFQIRFLLICHLAIFNEPCVTYKYI